MTPSVPQPIITQEQARQVFAAFAKLLPPQWAENAKKTRVATHMISRISDGEWAVGDKLPSIEDLCAEYEVSDGTIIAARNALVEQGLLRVEHGVGTFVERVPEDEPDEDDPLEVLKRARDDIDRAITTLERERG